jgi:hypothetical protein
MSALTVRLPEELDEALSDYCASRGAVKNRVVAIALRSLLGPSPALPVQPPDDHASEREFVDELVETLDAREVEA